MGKKDRHVPDIRLYSICDHLSHTAVCDLDIFKRVLDIIDIGAGLLDRGINVNEKER